MPQPTLQQSHVNVPLTNLSIAYLQRDTAYACLQAAPVIPVDHKTNVYYIYKKDEWFRDDVQERAPSSESSGNGYNLDNTAQYNCHVYSHHHDIDDQIRSNMDPMLNADRDASMFLMQKMQIHLENIFVQNCFGTGLWGNPDQTGVAASPGANQFLRWDLSGSTPIEDIQRQALVIASQTAYRPNTLVLGPYTALGLLNNPEIVDRVKYTQPGFINTDILATAFGVERVIVPSAIQNTNPEVVPIMSGVGSGAGTPTNTTTSWSSSFMYGKGALLYYRAPGAGLYQPSGIYTFGWRGLLGGVGNWVVVRRFRMEQLRSDRLEADLAIDVRLTGPDLGTFFATAVS